MIALICHETIFTAKAFFHCTNIAFRWKRITFFWGGFVLCTHNIASHHSFTCLHLRNIQHTTTKNAPTAQTRIHRQDSAAGHTNTHQPARYGTRIDTAHNRTTHTHANSWSSALATIFLFSRGAHTPKPKQSRPQKGTRTQNTLAAGFLCVLALLHESTGLCFIFLPLLGVLMNASVAG